MERSNDIQHAWRPLLGGKEGAAPRTQVARQVADAVAVAQRIPDFDGVTQEEMMQLVNVRQEEQTVEEMVEEADEEAEQAEQPLTQEGEVEEGKGQLSSAVVRELLSILETIKDKVLLVDNQPDRAATAVAALSSAMQPYKDLFNQYMSNRQQALITRYFKPHQPPATCSPQPVEEQEIDDIIAEVVDDNEVSSFDFGGFESGEEEVTDESGSDSE